MIAFEANPPPVERLIVEVRDGIPMSEALGAIRMIVLKGRISETNGKSHYCHGATCNAPSGPMVIACIPNSKSERFVVYKDKP